MTPFIDFIQSTVLGFIFYSFAGGIVLSALHLLIELVKGD